MRVCLLNESFPPVIDGVVNVMMNYAKYMMRDYDAKIIVGTPEYPDGKYNEYPYKVVPYPSIDTADFTNGYRTGYPLEGKAVSELANFNSDIIHSHCPATSTIVARLVREITGAPIIFTYHTKYDIDIRRAAKINMLVEETIKAMVQNIEACDDIWVVSDGAGKALKDLGFQGDYLVMNNGVDFAKGRVDKAAVDKATEGYDLPENVPVFLYVGRIMNYKNLPLILKALKILADSGQDFRMVFVGKGLDRPVLEQMATDMGLMGDRHFPGAGKLGKNAGSHPSKSAKVIFTGPIYDRDELRAWNTRADLFLFPSTFDTNGLVVREAAACGLASVLVKGSCAAEGITDDRNGFLIEESAEDMAKLLARVCKDMDHVHDVGQHAMDEIYLSWEECVSRAYKRYQFILDRKKAGLLPSPKVQTTDAVVKFAAKTISDQEKLRRKALENQEKMRLGTKKLRSDIRHNVIKLAEDAKMTSDAVKLLWDDLLEDAWCEVEDTWKK